MSWPLRASIESRPFFLWWPSGGFSVFQAWSLDAALDRLLQVTSQPEITSEWTCLVLGDVMAPQSTPAVLGGAHRRERGLLMDSLTLGSATPDPGSARYHALGGEAKMDIRPPSRPPV